MSYPLFLVVSLAITVSIAVALAGPLSVAAILGFWVVHYIFVAWSMNSASVKSMSDAQLRHVLSDWTRRGFNQYTSSELSRVIRTGNQVEIQRAVRRVLEIYNEIILRDQKQGLDVSGDIKERDELASRFSNGDDHQYEIEAS